MPKSKFDELLEALPKIAKVLQAFSEPLQQRVFESLLSALDFPTAPATIGKPGTPTKMAVGELTLHELAVKGLPNAEPEWIVTYSYYLTAEGNQTFSRDDLKAKYKESNRNSSSNMSNMSVNLRRAIERGWVRKINEDLFALADTGSEKVKEILNRQSGSAAPRRPKKAKTTNNSKDQPKRAKKS